MTREEAKKALEEDLPKVSQFSPKMASAYKVAISALSTEGEYIKKADALKRPYTLWNGSEYVSVVNEDYLNGLQTYSFPDSAETDTAKPESDLISRTQAINDYAQCFADEYGMDCGEMFIGVLHQCQTFPDSAENKGEWIPVSEENLPEDFQNVLVTLVRYNGTKVVRAAEYHEIPKLSRKIFRILENNERWDVGEKQLLAWMPKPEPYKAESEG